ncbi:MAG TPA: GFA family protein [Paracoccus sp. (in: a-proteobacteria)]|nr:GFA family protein [Paracoccus sp. (in: a-proteobacteria)]
MRMVEGGPDPDMQLAEGACHCGRVRFRVRLADGLRSSHRCDCSLCRMRGAAVVSAPAGAFEILSGVKMLAEYRFNTGTARHHFCRHCGIFTHHQRRSNPREYSVNVACLNGVSPFDFAELPVTDGRNHPSDGGDGGLAGVLRYEPIRR